MAALPPPGTTGARLWQSVFGHGRQSVLEKRLKMNNYLQVKGINNDDGRTNTDGWIDENGKRKNMNGTWNIKLFLDVSKRMHSKADSFDANAVLSFCIQSI